MAIAIKKIIVIIATIWYSVNFLIAGIPKLILYNTELTEASEYLVSSIGIPGEGVLIVGTVEVAAAFCIWFRNKNILGPLSCIGTLIITSIAIPLQLSSGFTIQESSIAIVGIILSVFLLITYRNSKIR